MASSFNGVFAAGDITFECGGCGYTETRYIDLWPTLEGLTSVIEKEDKLKQAMDGVKLDCGSCQKEMGFMIGSQAPAGFMKRDYDSEISGMRASFKHHFHKYEEDSIRHKHGVLYDDAKRSAAAQRIKKALGK